MTTALYPLDQYADIIEIEQNGEDEEAGNARIISRVEEIKDELETQADYLCRAIRSLEEEAMSFEAEAARLNAEAKYRKNRARRIKEFIHYRMDVAKLDKLKAGLFSLAIQVSPPAVEIIDENTIPDCFKEQRFVVLKKEIIDIWKRNGEDIPGAVVTQSRHLRIR